MKPVFVDHGCNVLAQYWTNFTQVICINTFDPKGLENRVQDESSQGFPLTNGLMLSLRPHRDLILLHAGLWPS
jgi:hypothetical protein